MFANDNPRFSFLILGTSKNHKVANLEIKELAEERE
jgi:hypothetical protein